MRASVEVECKEPEKILRAVNVDSEPTEKFSAKMSTEKNKILLEVEAKDIAGLMAGVNSNLKLIGLASETLEIE